MSFIDRERRTSPASIVAVVAVHAVIGYAIVSGLAIRVIPVDPVITTLTGYKSDPPPPPPVEPVTRRTTATPRDPRPTADPIIVQTIPTTFVDTILSQPPTTTPGTSAEPGNATSTLPPSKARGALVIGSRGTWVTTDDYPASAMRAGAEGTTAIVATIGIDGRVMACRVTASSGSGALDQAACRTYGRRARFQPALDAEGVPIASERADRIRWQLPPQ